jgi:predicted AlkP superfamily phosphohydrolase/phosphomutase
MSSSRVLVIGLDGGTFALLNPLIEQGLMPRLKALLERSSYGALESTVPPLTSPAWTSFATGQNPGKHSILLFTRPSREPGPPILASSLHIDRPTIWELAGESGKHVVAINVPMTWPAQPVNGIVVTGMMTPPQAAFTYPADLAERYPSLNDYVIDVNTQGRQHNVNIDDLFIAAPGAYIDQIDEMRRRRTRLALELLRQEPWQLFTLVYTGLDRLCHMMWKDLHGLATGSDAAPIRFADKLAGYVRSLDRDLGTIFETLDEHTHVVMMSDHGFGPRASKRFHLNAWLRQAGLLEVRSNGAVQNRPGYWLMRLKDGRFSAGIARRLARALPTRLRGRLRKQVNESQDALIDWQKTRAQTVTMAGSVAGIQLARDLDERERAAIVGRLQTELTEVTDPQTGAHVVRQVVRREELYTGRHVEAFPDLILFADEQYEVIDTLIDHGTIAPMLLSARTGDHRPDGMLVLCGPHIQPGRLQERWWIPDASASILYLLGVPLPEDLDGRVVGEALEATYLEQNPVQYAPASQAVQRRGATGTDPEGQEAVLARLRGLGYME